MNIFVLNSGRCGSTTFIAACRHITNFSAGHETRLRLAGPARLAYPDQHIEADNRLTWRLGQLDAVYGSAAWYVHLSRDRAATAASFARRAEFGILKAWRDGVLLEGEPGLTPEALADDYLAAVDANIRHFLKDKPKVLNVQLETAQADFNRFWDWIDAQGDRSAALAEWDVRHNASG